MPYLSRVPVPVASDRNRVVDLVRILALGGVVLGHWLKQGWYVDAAGSLHRAGLLGISPWTHPLTWVFQVIPLFFIVGGFVNALSWRHARSSQTSYGTWIAGRIGRLTRPLLPLLAFWLLVVLLAGRLGLGDDWLAIASKTSLVPLWFLATYVVVVALVPLTLKAWERWGAWTLAAGALALPVDAVSLSLDSTVVGGVNLLVVWGTLHQLGYAWQDGIFRRRSRAVALGLVGLLGAVTLVAVGPYGVSMVGVDGYGVNNTNPARATLVFLGIAMAGVLLAAEPALKRLCERPRVWWSVVVVERRVMTVYLWHPVALAILGGAGLAAGGIGLHAFPDTADWWSVRPLWLAALALTTLGLVALFGRFEDPVSAAPRRSALLPLLEIAVTSAMLAVLADRGLAWTWHGVGPWFFVGVTLLVLASLDRVLRRPRRSVIGRPRDSGPSPLIGSERTPQSGGVGHQLEEER